MCLSLCSIICLAMESAHTDLMLENVYLSSVDKHVKGSSATHISKKLKWKFTKAWLAFLKLPLPLDVYKEVLATLHQNVIPPMSNPAILCDFLTTSYDIGSVISVMALSGLFILMTQHQLEYPKFYNKLYALLTPAVFMAKHRRVFLQVTSSQKLLRMMEKLVDLRRLALTLLTMKRQTLQTLAQCEKV